MASGAPAAFAKAEPVLATMAKQVYRLGDEPGIGSTVKAVNQLLAGVHIAAAAEAMAFGVRAGADPRTLFEVISNSAGNSWIFGNRVPHMLDGDYTPRSAVEIFVKDLGLVLDAGRSLRFPLPQAAAAHQLFLMAAAAGLGREDDAAVVKVFERLAGIEVSRPVPQP
jgi:3-hydroxyisobutyrate dehydrogenase